MACRISKQLGQATHAVHNVLGTASVERIVTFSNVITSLKTPMITIENPSGFPIVTAMTKFQSCLNFKVFVISISASTHGFWKTKQIKTPDSSCLIQRLILPGWGRTHNKQMYQITHILFIPNT